MESQLSDLKSKEVALVESKTSFESKAKQLEQNCKDLEEKLRVVGFDFEIFSQGDFLKEGKPYRWKNHSSVVVDCAGKTQ